MYLGFDIGGTTIKYGVLDEDGKILEKSSIKTQYDTNLFYNDLFTIIKEAQKKYSLDGIGISAPGIVQKDGFMLTAGAIRPLYSENFKTTIENETKIPVCVVNDANAAAIAERWIGNAQNMDNYLCIVLGTGVGGGIVINGQVYSGAHGMAGEFGWMVIDSIPKEGDIEKVSINQRAAVVGGLIQIYNDTLEKNNRQNEKVDDARAIFDRANNGEIIALSVLDDYFTDLSICLINLISCFDPEAILVGGGISANEQFNKMLQDKLLEMETRHDSINYLKDKIIAPVIPAKLQNDAGMIGAVYQVHQYLKKNG